MSWLLPQYPNKLDLKLCKTCRYLVDDSVCIKLETESKAIIDKNIESLVKAFPDATLYAIGDNCPGVKM